MNVTVLLHGQHWPPEATLTALGTRLRECWSTVELIEVRTALAGLGPGASLNAAAHRAHGDILVMLEPWITDEPDDLRALAASAAAGLSRFTPEEDESLPLSATAVRARDAVIEALAAPGLRATASRLPEAWAVSRALFVSLGGLDKRLWLFGAWDDLVHRASRVGVEVQRLQRRAKPSRHASDASGRGPLTTHSTTTDACAYPLVLADAARLAWHNALVVSYLHDDPDRFGSQMAVTAITALAESWHVSALDASTLRFGAQWALTVADKHAALLPLAAVDTFARTMPEIARSTARTRTLAAPEPEAAHAESNAGGAEGIEVEGHHPPLRAAVGQAVGDDGRRGQNDSVARTATALPLVSVVVVNWNGREHLTPCFSSLLAGDYPSDRLELVCVDNGSTDGSAALLTAHFPTVRVVQLSHNRGFTGGNEAGVAASHGDVLVFLNNDMRVEPDAVRRLVEGLQPGIACTAARVLSWNGRTIDFIRGTINFEGRGYQEDHGKPSRLDRSSGQPTFFPNGGAFAVTREAYERAGGFDPAFFAYYDDVDLGWRLRVVGSDIRVVKEAVVYHRHGATGRKHPSGQKRYLMERNALWTIFKCYGTDALRRTLGPALLLAIRRVLQDARRPALGLAAGFPVPHSDASPRSRVAPPVPSHAPIPVDLQSARGSLAWRGIALESYAAVAVAAAELPRLLAGRHRVQGRRASADGDIVPHFGRALDYSSRRSSYMALHDALADELALPQVLRGTPHVLIITHESLKRNMSGPAIRALELGRALGHTARVTVAAPGEPEITTAECTLAGYSVDDATTIRRLAERADIMVVWGLTLGWFPFLRRMGVPLVIDLYCPFTLEYLEMKASDPAAAGADVAREAAQLLVHQNDLLDAGDFFICASERQRDFWLGAIHTAGRINPHTYRDDATLRTLIDVVPFGLPDEPFERAVARAGRGPHAIKGRVPGISEGDRVLLWGGSILDWQDPEVMVRAVGEIARRRHDVKLFFLGTKHPNPHVAPARVIERCRALARELGVLDHQVFFNDWVPYEERAAYLADADIGVSTHLDHLETRFSFRTRMLDYIWAGLPIVCTSGDHFADLVQREGLGRVVPPGDPHALAQALVDLLDDEAAAARCRERLGALGDTLRWSRVVTPLENYVIRGGFAGDHDRLVQAMNRELRASYKWTKWAKATALAFGVPEGTIEQVKGTAPVRAAMALRNRAAHWKAARRARRGH